MSPSHVKAGDAGEGVVSPDFTCQHRVSQQEMLVRVWFLLTSHVSVTCHSRRRWREVCSGFLRGGDRCPCPHGPLGGVPALPAPQAGPPARGTLVQVLLSSRFTHVIAFISTGLYGHLILGVKIQQVLGFSHCCSFAHQELSGGS